MSNPELTRCVFCHTQYAPVSLMCPICHPQGIMSQIYDGPRPYRFIAVDQSRLTQLNQIVNDIRVESALQHGAATFLARLSATGAASYLAEGNGAWRYGKRCAFPTSPHPRLRLRTRFEKGATLTFRLVQKIGQVRLLPGFHARSAEQDFHSPRIH